MKTHNTGIIILVETKVNSHKPQITIQNLKMSNYVCFFGRIWLLRKYTVDFQLEIISVSNRFVLFFF